MPQRADAPTAPNVQIDDEQKYILNVIELEETPSKFRDTRKDAMSIIWKFTVHDPDTGVAVLDENTNLTWEFWQFSPDTTYSNLKTGKKAKAREWTEALLGRSLTDAEMNDIIDQGFREALIGKRALADLEWYTTDLGVDRLRVIKLRPYKAAKNGAARAPVAAGLGDVVGVALGLAESKEDRKARLMRELQEADAAG